MSRYIYKVCSLLTVQDFQQSLEVKQNVVGIWSKLFLEVAPRLRWLLTLSGCDKVVTQTSYHLLLLFGRGISIPVHVGSIRLSTAVPPASVILIDGLGNGLIAVYQIQLVTQRAKARASRVVCFSHCILSSR